MSNIENIEIPLSKNKLFLGLFACIAFVVAGVFFIVSPTKFESPLGQSATFIFSVGIAGVLFFGAIVIVLIKKLMDKSPGLIVSAEGITDNSSGVSAGFIPWEDVAAITEMKVVNQYMINIIVKNPQDYINRGKTALKRKLMQANYNMYDTVIALTAKTLTIGYTELKALLDNGLSEFSAGKQAGGK